MPEQMRCKYQAVARKALSSLLFVVAFSAFLLIFIILIRIDIEIFKFPPFEINGGYKILMIGVMYLKLFFVDIFPIGFGHVVAIIYLVYMCNFFKYGQNKFLEIFIILTSVFVGSFYLFLSSL